MGSQDGRGDAHEPAPAETVPSAKASQDERRAPPRRPWSRVRRLLGLGPGKPGPIDKLILEAVPPQSERLTAGERLGEGGMATVEAVADRALRRRMAMKLLRSELLQDPRGIQSFIREAQITGQLDHPNVVPVYDLGRSDDGRLFFTMKLLRGRTLTELVGEPPALPLDRTTLFDLLEAVLRVCDALAFAHRRGVIHRDVKPDNVMVGDFGEVYLVDWGLARYLGGGEGEEEARPEPVSSSFDRVWRGAVVGTPAFMSPEQAAGGELDERADVFSAGALLYFVLARRPPYQGATVDEVVRLAMRGAATPLEEAASRARLPRELVRIVGRAMAPLPADRYPSVAELRRDLVTFMRGGSLPRVRFEPGHPIINEGDVGDAAYIIVEGRCQVFKTVDGERRAIRTIGPGESFGEMAILSPTPRTASVVALEATTVERLTRQELLEEMDVMKPWVSVLLRTLAERFQEREGGGRRGGPRDPGDGRAEA